MGETHGRRGGEDLIGDRDASDGYGVCIDRPEGMGEVTICNFEGTTLP